MYPQGGLREMRKPFTMFPALIREMYRQGLGWWGIGFYMGTVVPVVAIVSMAGLRPVTAKDHVLPEREMGCHDPSSV